ncbi:MAG: transglycosylase domain-containing protein [Syntrophaceae bacterium]|nr:transglycosylase domain-containing protein [Syntrophaceae bacterium]
MSSEGSKIIKSASKSLYPIAVAGETDVGIRSYAIKAAYTEFVFKKEHSRHLKWALNNLLWYYSSFFHFNDKDIFNIWSYFAPFEGGQGLDKSSLHYFNKPLTDLNDREYATLIAIVRSPSRYKPGSSKTEKRVDDILLKVKGS